MGTSDFRTQNENAQVNVTLVVWKSLQSQPGKYSEARSQVLRFRGQMHFRGQHCFFIVCLKICFGNNKVWGTRKHRGHAPHGYGLSTDLAVMPFMIMMDQGSLSKTTRKIRLGRKNIVWSILHDLVSIFGLALIFRLLWSKAHYVFITWTHVIATFIKIRFSLWRLVKQWSLSSPHVLNNTAKFSTGKISCQNFHQLLTYVLL